jgi:hypothetical protein
MKKSVKKEVKKPFLKNPLKVGAISGIAFISLMFISIIFSAIFNGTSFLNNKFFSSIDFVLDIVVVILSLAFFYAFLILGRKYDSKILRGASKVLIVLVFASFILNIWGSMAFPPVLDKINSIASSMGVDLSAGQELSEEQSKVLFLQILPDILPFIVAIIIFALIFVLVWIFFSVGLIKIGKKVKNAKVAGIINLVGIAFCLTIIGMFIGIILIAIAYCFEISLLFSENKK